MNRGGFTLLELMVAVVITGVVALLTYGTLGVGVDSLERQSDHDRALRRDRAWRAVIEDALRNIRSNEDYRASTLVLEHGVDGAGRPQDRLRFIAAGGTPPLTSDSDWIVSLEPGSQGIVLRATPFGVRSPERRLSGAPDVTGLDVRVYGGSERAEWLEEWNDRRILPRAIEITYWTDSGPTGRPLLLTLPNGHLP